MNYSSFVFHYTLLFSQRLLEEVKIVYLTCEILLGFASRIFLDSDGYDLYGLFNIARYSGSQNLRFD